MRKQVFLLAVLVVLALPAGATAKQNTSTIKEIVDTAYKFLESHFLHGERWGKHYHFYRPSLTKYPPTQWLWDSGSHMITWSHRNVTNSILDLRTMLSMQHASGFIPEMIFWGVEDAAGNISNELQFGNLQQANITQMPVLAFSLKAIWDKTGDVALLQEFVPKLVAYWDWWFNERNVAGHDMVSIIHGWESGLDASPLYDKAYRVPNPQPTFDEMYPQFWELMISYHYDFHWNRSAILSRPNVSAADEEVLNWFFVEDIGVNAVYAAGWEMLGVLADHFDPTLGKRCHDMSARVMNAMIQHSWREDLGRFVSWYREFNGTWVTTDAETVQSLFPLLLDLPDNITQRIINGQLLNKSKFWSPFPLPSVSQDSPAFNPVFSIDLMWRGPTWAFPNWFVMEGLHRQGRNDIVKKMAKKWINMVKRSGIYEMYNPLNGTAYGVEGLGMSCLIVDWIYKLHLHD